MALIIRKATIADNEKIRVILNDALAHKRRLKDSSWGDGEFTTQEVSELFQTGSVLLAEEDDKGIGCVHFTKSDTNMWNKKGSDGKALYIHRLSKAQDARTTQSVGRLLINKVAEYAKKMDKDYLRLDCPAVNIKLCAYYESLNFERVSTSEDKRVAYYQQTLAEY